MTNPPAIPLRGAVRPARPSLRRIVLVAVAGLFFAFVVLPWLGGFATDWLWFKEVHFEPVFFTSLVWRSALFVAGAAIAFAFIYGNVRIATAELAGFPALFVDRGGGVRVDISRFVPRIFLAGSLFVAFVTGLSISVLWMTMLMAIHGAPVGSADSLFGRDIGFYLFTLPAISEVLNTFVVLTVVSLAGAAVLYGLRGELPCSRQERHPRGPAPADISAPSSHCCSSFSARGSGLSARPSCSTRPQAPWSARAIPTCTCGFPRSIFRRSLR